MLKSSNRPVVPYDEYEYKAIRSKPNDAGQTDVFNVLYPLLPARSLIVTKRTEETELPLMNYDSSTSSSVTITSGRIVRTSMDSASALPQPSSTSVRAPRSSVPDPPSSRRSSATATFTPAPQRVPFEN